MTKIDEEAFIQRVEAIRDRLSRPEYKADFQTLIDAMRDAQADPVNPENPNDWLDRVIRWSVIGCRAEIDDAIGLLGLADIRNMDPSGSA